MEEKTYIVELTERERRLLWSAMQFWNIDNSWRQSGTEPGSDEWVYFQWRIRENTELMEKLR